MSKPNVLLLTGGGYHDFSNGATIIEQTLSQRFEVTATTDTASLANLSNDKFASVVIYTQGGELSDDQATGLANFVERGGGLVGIHCASDSFKSNHKYMQLIGSEFVGHGPVMEFSVRFTDPQHPVAQRCDEFRIVDELYLLKDHANYETFAVAHWQGKDRPMGYQRNVGNGKVIYLANGHDPRALGNRYFQRMLERAVRTATGERFDTKVRAGILGYGGAFNMGRKHAETIRAQPGMDAVAVCDLDPSRTEQAKTELGQSIKTYNDMNRFFQEGEFDLAVIILPHNLHAKACIAAAEAGKSVVTEKPFCVTLDEADRMIAAARENNVAMSCFHNRRWNGDFTRIMELVRGGEIGEVFRVDAASSGFGEPKSWWRSSKEISGGAMYDWGAHYCDWLLNIMNKRIKSVVGDFQKRKWHHVTNEDYTYALIRFEDDTTATLEQGSLAAIGRGGWRILGTEGGISNPGPQQPLTVKQWKGNKVVESSVPANPERAGYYANIGNHLIMGERLVITPEQARRAIGVIHLAEESAKQGGVPLALPGEDQYTPDYIMPW